MASMLPTPERARWCNFLYTTKCPFCVNHLAGTMEPCKFLHIDSYVSADAADRPPAPHAMTRHVKSLVKEMAAILEGRAKQKLTSWFVQTAWGATSHESFESLNPYSEVVDSLRALGWAIPQRSERCVSVQVGDAPYAGDIATIIALIGNMLHYDIGSMPDVMLETIAWVLRLERPSMRCPEVGLDDGNIMNEFFYTEADDDDSSSMRSSEDAHSMGSRSTSVYSSGATSSAPPLFRSKVLCARARGQGQHTVTTH